MLYITSDLHFCHERDFIYKPRGYKTVNGMNKGIVKNWNSIITNDDEVYLLGDIMLNNNEEGLKYFKKLKGKIHIILGNHDTINRKDLFLSLDNVVSVEYATIIKYKKWHFYLSHYPTITTNQKKTKKSLTLWNLCGHYHTKDKFDDMKRGWPCYHIELDAHNNKPVSIEEIIEDIKSFDI